MGILTDLIAEDDDEFPEFDCARSKSKARPQQKKRKRR